MLDLLIVVPHDEFNFEVAYCKKFLLLPQPGQIDILDRSSFLYFYETFWA